MAGRGPTVTLTFVGDSDRLSRTLAKVKAESKDLDRSLDKVSTGVVRSMGVMAGTTLASAGVMAGAWLGIEAAIAGATAVMVAVPLAIGAIGIKAAAQAKQVQDAFTGLKEHVNQDMQALTKPIQDVLVGLAGKTTTVFNRVAPALGRMFEKVSPFIDNMGTALLRVAERAMPGLERAVNGAMPLLNGFADWFGNQGPRVGNFFASLPGLIETLRAKLADFSPVVEVIKNGFMQLAPHLKEVFDTIVGNGGNIATALQNMFTALNALMPLFTGLLGLVLKLSPNLLPLAVGVFAVVKAVQAFTAAQEFLNLVLEANPIMLMISLIGLLVGALIYAWNNSETFRDIIKGVFSAVATAVSAAVGFIKGVIFWFGNLPGMIGGWFRSAYDAAKGWLGNLVGFVRGLPGMILSALGNMGKLLWNAGADLLRGLWNGLKSLGSWLLQQIGHFFGNLLPGWVKKMLGIHSPSKVFADIGEQIPAGLAQGITDNLGPVKSALSTMAMPFDFNSRVTYEDGSSQTGAEYLARWGDTPEFRRAWMDSLGGGGLPTSGGGGYGGGGQVNVSFSGNVDSAFATAFMKLVRTGQIQIQAA